MAKVEDILKCAEKYVGAKENSPMHLELLSKYAEITPLPRGYKPTVYDPWCAVFISALAIETGCTDIIPCECSCTKMRNKAKDLGIWKDYSDDFVPPSGAIIMWDWDATKGNGPDHVGLVVYADSKLITVIDGNWSNMVCLRNVYYEKIHGYILPKYEEKKQDIRQFIICPHCGDKIYFKGE